MLIEQIITAAYIGTGTTNHPTAPHDTPWHPTAPKFTYIYHQKSILEEQ